MTTRPSTHANKEKAIFDAFLAAHPSFATQVKHVDQPDDAFPDIVVTTTADTVIDFELGEWLDGVQMGSAKSYERLEMAMIDAIGPQSPNLSSYFRAVRLIPREDLVKFVPRDRNAFRTELLSLVAATEDAWPQERAWHSPQGRHYRGFAEPPTLGKYLSCVHFDPISCPPGLPYDLVLPARLDIDCDFGMPIWLNSSLEQRGPEFLRAARIRQ